MNRIRHVTYTIKDNMNRVRYVTYTTKITWTGSDM
jgi:hypothetical protein